MDSTIFCHDTATVDDGARIGSYTSIWHYSHVESNAVVGENCNLGQNIYIGNNAVVGNACRLGNSVSVFNHIILEDFVFCAPFMVFTHIGFPRAAVNRHATFEKTIVRVGATLGANSTIVPGVEIGRGAFVAAGSVLTKSCSDWALMVGVPARQVGWVSAFGDKIPMALCGDDEWRCPHTGDRYLLSGSQIIRHAATFDMLFYRHGEKLVRPVLTSS